MPPQVDPAPPSSPKPPSTANTTTNPFALPPLTRCQKPHPISKQKRDSYFPPQPANTTHSTTTPGPSKQPEHSQRPPPTAPNNAPSITAPNHVRGQIPMEPPEGWFEEGGWLFEKLPGNNMRGIFYEKVGERSVGRSQRRGAIVEEQADKDEEGGEYMDQDEFAVKSPRPPPHPTFPPTFYTTTNPKLNTSDTSTKPITKPGLKINTKIPSIHEQRNTTNDEAPRKIAILKKSRFDPTPAPKTGTDRRTETKFNGLTGLSALRPKAVKFAPFSPFKIDGAGEVERTVRISAGNKNGDENKNAFFPHGKIRMEIETRITTETMPSMQDNKNTDSTSVKTKDRNKSESETHTQKKEIATQTLNTTTNETNLLKEEICSLRRGLDEARKREEELVRTLSAQVTLHQEMLAEHAIISRSLKERLVSDREVVDELQTTITRLNVEKKKISEEKEKFEEDAREMEEMVREIELLTNNLCVGPERQMGPWTDPRKQLWESLVGSIWGAYGHVQSLEKEKRLLREEVKRLRRKLSWGGGKGITPK